MPPGDRVHPFSASHFRVEIDGIAATEFLSVTGIEADASVVEYRSGTDKSAPAHKMPGLVRVGNIVLTRGLTSDLSLWQWMQETLSGQVSRRNMSVALVNDAAVLMRFNFTNAWPVRWTGPHLEAEAGDVALETLEVTHEGMTIVAS